MHNNKRILAIIPARGGSKGIPRKNIRILGGKPLIAYSIDPGKQSKYIDRIIVSSDDQEIIDIAKSCGAEAPFVRPAELAVDTAKSLPVLQHAVLFCETEEHATYDYIVLLEPTGPMRIVDDIDSAIELAVLHNAHSVVGLVELEDEHPVRVKKIVDNRIDYFAIPEPEGLRRQDQEKAYLRNGSIYVFERNNLINNNSLYGTISIPYVMPLERSVNIDREVDLLIAEYFLKKRGY